MLYHLLLPLAEDFQLFNVLRYLTFRTGGAVMTALVICFIIGPGIIAWLRGLQRYGQPMRDLGQESHLKKRGTPTMGGLMILISMVISTLLWADLRSPFVWIVMATTLGFGTIGYIDDYRKLVYNTVEGLSRHSRIAAELIIAAIAGFAIHMFTGEGLETHLTIPFLKDVLIDLGIFFFPFAMLVMIGSANAVNLTDGLDGLAIVPAMIAAACFGLISYLVGNAVFADYLHLNFVPGTGELSIICGAFLGAGLGFLWFNAPPAQIFMGDTGSLSLGAALGSIAIITKHEIVLAIIGGLFVLETISVILQMLSYKFLGRRMFRMAPLHHHFEQKGWQETTIVVRFWIIAVILALIGLSTLKLR